MENSTLTLSGDHAKEGGGWRPSAVYNLHFCTGTLVAKNCARIDGGSHGILLQLEAGVSERCNKSLKV